MKTIFTILSLTLSFTLQGQIYLNSLDTLKQIHQKVYDSTENILTEEGINLLFAEEIAYFLSGSRDLSLFNAYASTNTDNNRLLLAYNASFPKNKSGFYVNKILTLGIEADVKDGISNLIKNDEFTNNVGFKLKWTWMTNGKVFFGQPEDGKKLKFHKKRVTVIDKIYTETILPTEAMIKNIGNSEASKSENEKLKKEALLKFYQEEIAAFKKSKAYFNSFHKWWFTFSFFVPVTKGKFLIVNDSLSSAIKENKTYLFEGKFLINHFVQFPWLRATGTIGGELKNFNTALSEENTKLSQTTTQVFNNSILSSSPKTVYLGGFNNFLSPSLLFDITFFPDFIFKNKPSPFGLSFELNKVLEVNDSEFNSTLYKIGIPLTLKDKEGKPKINFEPQVAFINKDGSTDVFLRVGLALPFGSLIY